MNFIEEKLTGYNDVGDRNLIVFYIEFQNFVNSKLIVDGDCQKWLLEIY